MTLCMCVCVAVWLTVPTSNMRHTCLFACLHVVSRSVHLIDGYGLMTDDWL